MGMNPEIYRKIEIFERVFLLVFVSDTLQLALEASTSLFSEKKFIDLKNCEFMFAKILHAYSSY